MAEERENVVGEGEREGLRRERRVGSEAKVGFGLGAETAAGISGWRRKKKRVV